MSTIQAAAQTATSGEGAPDRGGAAARRRGRRPARNIAAPAAAAANVRPDGGMLKRA